MKAAATFGKKTIRDVDVAGKRVFLRADLNVPIDDGRTTVAILSDGRTYVEVE